MTSFIFDNKKINLRKDLLNSGNIPFVFHTLSKYRVLISNALKFRIQVFQFVFFR